MRTRTKLHIPGSDIKIGDRVRDAISKFEGIVTTHSRHLTGCDTLWLTSETETHEGKSVQRCFDVMQLELVEENPLGVQGFPQDVPSAG